MLAGSYKEHQGYVGEHLPLNYYDLQLEAGAENTLTMGKDESVMLFTLIGDIEVDGQHIEEKRPLN